MSTESYKEFKDRKWFWMMSFCRKKGISPADSFNWIRAEKEFHIEAVQRGFATWVSDENGNTHFEWKEPTP